jgi:hypothetical protein
MQEERTVVHGPTKVPLVAWNTTTLLSDAAAFDAWMQLAKAVPAKRAAVNVITRSFLIGFSFPWMATDGYCREEFPQTEPYVTDRFLPYQVKRLTRNIRHSVTGVECPVTGIQKAVRNRRKDTPGSIDM